MQRSGQNNSFKQPSTLCRQNQSVQGEHPMASSSQRSLSIAQQPRQQGSRFGLGPLEDATNRSQRDLLGRPLSRTENTIDALQDEVASLKKSLENDTRSRLDVPFFSVASKLAPIPSLAIKSRRLLKGPNGKVLNLDWSQDKRHLVSSTQDGKLLVWDAFPNNVKAEHIISIPNTWVMTCSYAPSGNFIAGGGLDNKITAYPLYSDDDTLMGPTSTSSGLGGSPNYIGGGSAANSTNFGGLGLGAGNPSNLSTSCSGAQGQSLASGQANSSNLSVGGCSGTLGSTNIGLNSAGGYHASSGSSAGSGSPAGNQLGSSQSIKKKPIGTHTAYTSCSQFFGNDQQILTGSGDSTCALWNVECGTIIHSFHGHLADVLSLDVSPSETGNTFVSVGCDKRALIWDTRVGHCGQNQYIQSFKAHIADINSVKFYPSGDSIVTGSDDTTCRLYDLRADQEVAVYEKNSILFGINSVDLSISGRILFAGGSDYTIHVWDALRCTRICILYGHENRVTCVRVSADGTALASSSWDHSIRIWA